MLLVVKRNIGSNYFFYIRDNDGDVCRMSTTTSEKYGFPINSYGKSINCTSHVFTDWLVLTVGAMHFLSYAPSGTCGKSRTCSTTTCNYFGVTPSLIHFLFSKHFSLRSTPTKAISNYAACNQMEWRLNYGKTPTRGVVLLSHEIIRTQIIHPWNWEYAILRYEQNNEKLACHQKYMLHKFIGELNLKCHIKERKLFSFSQTEWNEIILFETMKLFIWVHILSLVLSRRPKIQLFSLSHRALFPYHICCCSCDECLITKGGKWDCAKSLSNQNHSQAWSQTDKKQGLNFKVVGH